MTKEECLGQRIDEHISALEDVVRRIGVAANPEWIRSELQRLINKQRFFRQYDK